MLLIIYALIWILTAAAASILFVSGNLNELTITLFGFLATALIFMGMVGVLPWWVDKKYSRYSQKY